jgi:hypothetical protein
MPISSILGRAPKCVQESDTDRPGPMRLRAVAEPDSGRILGRLQNLNLTPRRMLVESTSNVRLYIGVDIVGVSERDLALIVVQVRQDPSVFDAHWHPIC